MKRLIPALLVACILGACAATSSSGVESTPDGLHKVAQRGTSQGVSTNSLRAQATQEATDFCAKTGKPLRVSETRELAPWLHSGRPAVEVLFKCE